MEIMDYVNENDEVMGQASKDDVYARGLTHRIVHVWIWNSEGKMLLHRRSANCSFCPLHWSMSAAGHVDAGESYEVAAARELQEELGVHLLLTYLQKFYYTIDPRNILKFIALFRAESNGPFVLNSEEVAEAKFVSVNEVKEMIKAGEPFHPQFLYVFEKML